MYCSKCGNEWQTGTDSAVCPWCATLCTKETRYHKYELRTIDAWRDGKLWVWNDSTVLERDIMIAEDATTRQILAMLRRGGFLSQYSAGKVRLQDDWPTLEVQNKNTYEPILALITEED